MTNLAVFLGDGVSGNHVNDLRHYTGSSPASLKMFKGTPTTDPANYGKGTSKLYVAAHGSPKKMAGMTASELLMELWIKGLDSSKFGTIVLYSCSTAQGAHGFDGKSFASSFYEACQKNKAYEGVEVWAFLGVIDFALEGGNRDGVVSGVRRRVLLPDGKETTMELGMVTLSRSGGTYIPPIFRG